MKRFPILAVVTILALGLASVALSQFSAVRPSALKGSWYPADGAVLGREVDTLLEKVPRSVEGKSIVGMISPHASYAYSGEVAAWGYKNLSGLSFRHVIILAPSHYVPFDGVSIPRVEFYETPLGTVRVDRKSCESLLQKPLFQSIYQAHQMEHAVEIQLPFLQRTLKDFSLIPLVVGSLKAEHYESISHELRALWTPDTLLIASSDFTHFGPRFGYVPFASDFRENISMLDRGAIDLILGKDWEGFLTYRERTQASICGFRPIALLLKVLPSDTHGKLLRYRLSGDITGDYTNSVSYASIIFMKAR